MQLKAIEIRYYWTLVHEVDIWEKQFMMLKKRTSEHCGIGSYFEVRELTDQVCWKELNSSSVP